MTDSKIDEANVVAEVRNLVKETAGFEEYSATTKAFVDSDETILRFVRARQHDIKKAVQMIQNTLEWREETKPEQAVCPLCRDEPQIHSMRVVGHDEEGLPLAYSQFGPSSRRNENFMEHLLSLLESTGDQQMSWAIDFKGYSYLWDSSISRFRTIISLLNNHYPEKLKQILLLDSPMVFGGVWAVIKPFIDKRTAKKLAFVSASKPDALLEHGTGHELAEWIKEEMQQNRDSEIQPKKAWWKDLSAYSDDVTNNVHSDKGTHSYIKHLQQQVQRREST